MKFKLTFKMDNAAFKPYPETEIETILEDIKRQVRTGRMESTIYDTNGNHIGNWQIIGK